LFTRQVFGVEAYCSQWCRWIVDVVLRPALCQLDHGRFLGLTLSGRGQLLWLPIGCSAVLVATMLSSDWVVYVLRPLVQPLWLERVVFESKSLRNGPANKV